MGIADGLKILGIEDEPELNSSPVARDATELAADSSLVEPPVLIAGLLHKGKALLLGASSKSFKSWSLIDLGLSVANGAPWWGMPTQVGKVLFVDFELTAFFWRKRALDIAQARGLTLNNIRIMNCRGYDATSALIAIEKEALENACDLIIIDPLYSLLAGKDENSAGDINTIMIKLGDFLN